jgi:hypothetical protein
MSQEDRARKKAADRTSRGWDRTRMNKTHRKGKKKAKAEAAGARRRLSKAVAKADA